MASLSDAPTSPTDPLMGSQPDLPPYSYNSQDTTIPHDTVVGSGGLPPGASNPAHTNNHTQGSSSSRSAGGPFPEQPASSAGGGSRSRLSVLPSLRRKGSARPNPFIQGQGGQAPAYSEFPVSGAASTSNNTSGPNDSNGPGSGSGSGGSGSSKGIGGKLTKHLSLAGAFSQPGAEMFATMGGAASSGTGVYDQEIYYKEVRKEPGANQIGRHNSTTGASRSNSNLASSRSNSNLGVAATASAPGGAAPVTLSAASTPDSSAAAIGATLAGFGTRRTSGMKGPRGARELKKSKQTSMSETSQANSSGRPQPVYSLPFDEREELPSETSGDELPPPNSTLSEPPQYGLDQQEVRTTVQHPPLAATLSNTPPAGPSPSSSAASTPKLPVVDTQSKNEVTNTNRKSFGSRMAKHMSMSAGVGLAMAGQHAPDVLTSSSGNYRPPEPPVPKSKRISVIGGGTEELAGRGHSSGAGNAMDSSASRDASPLPEVPPLPIPETVESDAGAAPSSRGRKSIMGFPAPSSSQKKKKKDREKEKEKEKEKESAPRPEEPTFNRLAKRPRRPPPAIGDLEWDEKEGKWISVPQEKEQPTVEVETETERGQQSPEPPKSISSSPPNRTLPRIPPPPVPPELEKPPSPLPFSRLENITEASPLESSPVPARNPFSDSLDAPKFPAPVRSASGSIFIETGLLNLEPEHELRRSPRTRRGSDSSIKRLSALITDGSAFQSMSKPGYSPVLNKSVNEEMEALDILSPLSAVSPRRRSRSFSGFPGVNSGKSTPVETSRPSLPPGASPPIIDTQILSPISSSSTVTPQPPPPRTNTSNQVKGPRKSVFGLGSFGADVLRHASVFAGSQMNDFNSSTPVQDWDNNRRADQINERTSRRESAPIEKLMEEENAARTKKDALKRSATVAKAAGIKNPKKRDSASLSTTPSTRLSLAASSVSSQLSPVSPAMMHAQGSLLSLNTMSSSTDPETTNSFSYQGKNKPLLNPKDAIRTKRVVPADVPNETHRTHTTPRGGSYETVSAPGSSQYVRGGISACSLACLNAAREIFSGNLTVEDMSPELLNQITRICAHWSSPEHLDVETVFRAMPMFHRSMSLVGEEKMYPVSQTGFRDMLDILTTQSPSVMFITRPPEIIALFCLSGQELVVFDSHSRPQHPSGSAFTLLGKDRETVVDYLKKLLPIPIPDILATSPTPDRPQGTDWLSKEMTGFFSGLHLSGMTRPASASVDEFLEDEMFAANTAALKDQLTLHEETRRLHEENMYLRALLDGRDQFLTTVALANANVMKSFQQSTNKRGSLYKLRETWKDGVRSELAPGLSVMMERQGLLPLRLSIPREDPPIPEEELKFLFQGDPRGGKRRRSSARAPSAGSLNELSHDGPELKQNNRVDPELVRAARESVIFTGSNPDSTPGQDPLDTPHVFTCGICLVETEYEDLGAELQCRHEFCRDCLYQYIIHTLQAVPPEPRFPVKCPSCPVEFTHDEAELVLKTEEELALWDSLQMTVLALPLPCPNCKDEAWIERNELLDAERFQCPVGCGYIWCRRCQVKLEDMNASHECAANELDIAMEKLGYKRCPTCGTNVEKNSGCNHMSCPAPGCNTHFCYRDHGGVVAARIITSSDVVDVRRAVSEHFKTNCQLFDLLPPLNL